MGSWSSIRTLVATLSDARINSIYFEWEKRREENNANKNITEWMKWRKEKKKKSSHFRTSGKLSQRGHEQCETEQHCICLLCSSFPMPRDIWSIEYGIHAHTHTAHTQCSVGCLSHIHWHRRHRRRRRCRRRRQFGFILPFGAFSFALSLSLSHSVSFWVFGRINKTYKPSCACVSNIVYLEPSRHTTISSNAPSIRPATPFAHRHCHHQRLLHTFHTYAAFNLLCAVRCIYS